jgi:hypothetical protein
MSTQFLGGVLAELPDMLGFLIIRVRRSRE